MDCPNMLGFYSDHQLNHAAKEMENVFHLMEMTSGCRRFPTCLVRSIWDRSRAAEGDILHIRSLLGCNLHRHRSSVVYVPVGGSYHYCT